MAENTEISWTDHTFNGWWGCTKVGPGCDHCYAETFDKRVGGSHWGAGAPRRLIKDWSGPAKWQREAERTGIRPWVFCASMSDVFDNEVPPEWRARLWQTVEMTPLLRWQFVTKRIGNAAKMMPPREVWRQKFRHVGIMSTIVNQEEADRDIGKLAALKHSHDAAWIGLSMEPLLGPVDLTPWVADIDWIVCGGESGPGARPMSIQWVRELRDQCSSANVAFHFKQWGNWRPAGFHHSEASGRFAFGDYEYDRSRMIQTDHYPRQFTKFGARSVMEFVGKKASGRLLDGVEHNDRPTVFDRRKEAA